MPNSKLIVGLCSYGLSSQVFHAPYISRNADYELKYIVERNMELSKREYPEAIILKSFEELIAKEEVDLIVVNTPTYLHHPMAFAALKAGKHVVLEKPMSTTLLEAEELVNLAKSKDLVLAVYHNRRLESGFKTMQNIVAENTLGELTYFKAHFNRFKPVIGPKKWKEEAQYKGAGIFYDLAPHLLDQAITLFGDPLNINKTFRRERPNSEVDDYFLIELNYANGLKVELEAGMSTQTEEPKYVLKGSLGTYVKLKEDHQEDALRQGIFPSSIDEDFGSITFANGEVKTIPNVEGSYGDFYTNLSQAIYKKEALLISPEEAMKVIRLMLC